MRVFAISVTFHRATDESTLPYMYVSFYICMYVFLCVAENVRIKHDDRFHNTLSLCHVRLCAVPFFPLRLSSEIFNTTWGCKSLKPQCDARAGQTWSDASIFVSTFLSNEPLSYIFFFFFFKYVHRFPSCSEIECEAGEFELYKCLRGSPCWTLKLCDTTFDALWIGW